MVPGGEGAGGLAGGSGALIFGGIGGVVAGGGIGGGLSLLHVLYTPLTHVVLGKILWEPLGELGYTPASNGDEVVPLEAKPP